MSSIKVTQIPNFTPTIKELNVGDLLINSYDGNIFIKQQQNKNQSIISLRSTGSSVNTGSFVVDLDFSNPFLTATKGDNSTFERNLSTLVPISASYAGTASYALSSSYALNGGVTQIIAGTNVTLSPAGGTGTVTVNAILASTGSGSPNGPLYSLQYNNGGLFSGSGNFTLLNNNSLYLTGSLNVSGSIIGNLTGTSSRATTASYALNGGVTQLLAGANISLSPTNGLGQVTITSTGGGGGTGNTATGSYGSFYSTQTQTNVASTARSMSLNVTDITNGVSVSGSTSPFNTYIKVQNPGVYDIQFSAQVDKTDSGTDEIWIWIRKNGTNISDSATSIQLVGNGAHYVAAWNFFVNAAANDYFQLMWYSPDANVRLHAESAFGVVPGIPSLIVTANRVDQFLSNTGSFSGLFVGSFTGSLFGTSSWSSNAVTASYVVTAQTASYVLNAVSSSFAVSSSRAVSSSFALTSSFPWFQTGSNIAYIGGNVGIGTAPSTSLHVYSITPVRSETTSGNIKAGYEMASLYYGGVGAGTYFYPGGPAVGNNIFGEAASNLMQTNLFQMATGTMKIGTVGLGATQLYTNSLPRLTILSTGEVGIGTISPSARLTVQGSGTTSATTGFRVENSSATGLFVVRNDGFVGIGTTGPSDNLTVIGSTALYGGQTTITGATSGSGTSLLVRNLAGTSALTISNTRASSFNGNVDISGNLTANSSASIRRFQSGYYMDLHPESGNNNILPFYSNDIAYNTLRGGTFTASFGSGSTYTLAASQVEAMFDGSPNYNVMNATQLSGSMTASITFPQNYNYGNIVGFSFGSYSWVAKDFTVEILVTGSYTTLDTQTNYQYANYSKEFNVSGEALQGMRITFSNFVSPTSTSGFRIAQIFLLNYNGTLGKAVFLGRDGGAVYKPITIQSGSTSTPSYSTLTDTNTGIYFPAADTIGFVEGGAEAMRLDSSGRLSIGKTTANSTLDILGNLTVTGSTISTLGFTGSLQGTSSWANNSISSSFASTASLAPLYVLTSATSSMLVPYVLNSQTSSFVTNSQTSSFVQNSQTSSFVQNSQTSSMLAPYLLTSRTSSFATTGSNTFKDNQIVTGSITSTSEITAAGNVTAEVNLKSMFQSGDEGGEIFLNAPATNTIIPNGVTIDVYQNRLRIFEQGGTANGYYLDMPSGLPGVGTNLSPVGYNGPAVVIQQPSPNPPITLNIQNGIIISVT